MDQGDKNQDSFIQIFLKKSVYRTSKNKAEEYEYMQQMKNRAISSPISEFSDEEKIKMSNIIENYYPKNDQESLSECKNQLKNYSLQLGLFSFVNAMLFPLVFKSFYKKKRGTKFVIHSSIFLFSMKVGILPFESKLNKLQFDLFEKNRHSIDYYKVIQILEKEAGKNLKSKNNALSDSLQALDTSIVSHMDNRTKEIVLEELESDIKKN